MVYNAVGHARDDSTFFVYSARCTCIASKIYSQGYDCDCDYYCQYIRLLLLLSLPLLLLLLLLMLLLLKPT